MSATHSLLSTDGLARLEDCGAHVVDEVVNLFYERHGEHYARFGKRGRRACAEDIAFHLEFLKRALGFGQIGPFLAYVRWLVAVLESRDVPPQHVFVSLELIAEVIGARLGEPDATRVKTVVSQAMHALSDVSDHSELYAFPDKPTPEREAMASALLNGDQRQARAIVEAARKRCGLMFAYVNIIQAALYDVGIAWSKNRISVAREHLATAIAQTVMIETFVTEELPPKTSSRVLIACVEGNHHALGSRMIADAFELAGWNVIFLGANTPSRALLSMVRETAPHLLGLSASLPQHLKTARDTIHRLRTEIGSACPPVMIGGLVVNQFQNIASAIGADLTSRDATRVARDASSCIHGHTL